MTEACRPVQDHEEGDNSGPLGQAGAKERGHRPDHPHYHHHHQEGGHRPTDSRGPQGTAAAGSTGQGSTVSWGCLFCPL